MIITDLKKLDGSIRVKKQLLQPRCEELYLAIKEFVEEFDYTERDSKFLMDNWLRKEGDLAVELGINPSTVGNKKGKMTKEIEKVLPRRLIKRLNKVNEKLEIAVINNEDVPLDVLDELEDIQTTVDIVTFKVERSFPEALSTLYQALKKNVDGDVKEIDYDIDELEDELVAITEVSTASMYYNVLSETDPTKIFFILDKMYSDNSYNDIDMAKTYIYKTLQELYTKGTQDAKQMIADALIVINDDLSRGTDEVTLDTIDDDIIVETY